MINTEIKTTKEMEQAQKQMEQAKKRMALEKKKANEERRRRENANKYMMGGVVHKYFPECYCFEESEMNEILKVALATPQCQKVIADIKARATNQVLSCPVESEVKSNESIKCQDLMYKKGVRTKLYILKYNFIQGSVYDERGLLVL